MKKPIRYRPTIRYKLIRLTHHHRSPQTHRSQITPNPPFMFLSRLYITAATIGVTPSRPTDPDPLTQTHTAAIEAHPTSPPSITRSSTINEIRFRFRRCRTKIQQIRMNFTTKPSDHPKKKKNLQIEP